MKFKLSHLKYLPLALILIIIWAPLKLNNLINSQATVTLSIIAITCFVVLSIEFFKSGSITLSFFALDVITAFIATVIGTFVFTRSYTESWSNFSVSDIFVAILIAADGTISIINSFRVARRDWSASIGQASI
ncbi:MAG: hypothetical protein ACP5OG_05910 [Candidatus Nanoarchaeia archaeon]